MDHDKFVKFLNLLKEYGLLPDCDQPLEEYSQESLDLLKEFYHKVLDL